MVSTPRVGCPTASFARKAASSVLVLLLLELLVPLLGSLGSSCNEPQVTCAAAAAAAARLTKDSTCMQSQQEAVRGMPGG
jgi:hypothetical protein